MCIYPKDVQNSGVPLYMHLTCSFSIRVTTLPGYTSDIYKYNNFKVNNYYKLTDPGTPL